jgi:hypothetical protein
VFEALIAPIALALIAVVAIAAALVARWRRASSSHSDHRSASPGTRADDRPRERRFG